MNLSTPLIQIKGVGSKTAAKLAAASLNNVGDLITFMPRDYQDYSHIIKIADIKPGKVTIKATCDKISTRPVRRGLKVTTAILADASGKLQAVWFNQPYRETQLKTGEEFFFSGEFEFSFNRYQLTNPSAEKASEMPINTDRILPIYRAVAGLKPALVRKVLTELKPLISMLPETLPVQVVQEQALVSRSQALLGVHFPQTIDDATLARERLAFEELFQLLLASQYNKQANSNLEGWQIPFNKAVVQKFVQELPFKLTNAQRRAAWDILQDFERQSPMNRLMQGDVGSGKTVVASLAARQASYAGFQTAIMAPTEILATQHAATLDSLLAQFGVRVGLLTGSVKGKARQSLYRAIEQGEVDVIVGTNALIQSTVKYHRLGFVVIDEQHRFGVAQRQELLKKSAKMPHLLSMTATPIPRSLSLTVYGELDISVLNEKPSNRKPIITKIWSPDSRPQLYQQIDNEISKGRQVYVICNLIDANPSSELKSVEAEYVRLNVGVFKHRQIGLLHGRLSSAEKEAVMDNFATGKIDILVSTTVVEVGVDIPNATVMLIEDGDHFGLAQLHQLRGRVGRSDYQSYCYIVPSDSKKPSQRLKEIEKTNDGFYLAEVDLQLRGPGEIYGRAQHGALNLQIATLADTKLIAKAQKSAQWFVQTKQNLLQYNELAQQIEIYQRLTTLN